MENIEKKYVKCLCSYVEDENEYWTQGCTYEFQECGEGNYEIETNFGGHGCVGPDYMCNSFEEYFEVI